MDKAIFQHSDRVHGKKIALIIDKKGEQFRVIIGSEKQFGGFSRSVSTFDSLKAAYLYIAGRDFLYAGSVASPRLSTPTVDAAKAYLASL